jgi:hypothetical protein
VVNDEQLGHGTTVRVPGAGFLRTDH